MLFKSWAIVQDVINTFGDNFIENFFEFILQILITKWNFHPHL